VLIVFSENLKVKDLPLDKTLAHLLLTDMTFDAPQTRMVAWPGSRGNEFIREPTDQRGSVMPPLHEAALLPKFGFAMPLGRVRMGKNGMENLVR
jgi:hypothetical protein